MFNTDTMINVAAFFCRQTVEAQKLHTRSLERIFFFKKNHWGFEGLCLCLSAGSHSETTCAKTQRSSGDLGEGKPSVMVGWNQLLFLP